MTKLSVKIAGIAAVFAFALTAVTANAAFTRDLTLGSTGADVIELQTWLETKGFLVIPAGTSKGYFGALTQAALAKYQVSAGITPAAGYFGPITRAKIAAEGMPSTPNDDEDDEDDNNGDLSGGEASLEAFDLSSGDDSDVEEGASGEIAEIEFDVEDGDIQIDRIDLALVAGSSTQEETDPWDTFDSLRLLVEGDEIAEMDLSDEDEYLDEDEGTIRLSGIDYVVREGETVTVVVEVTAQNSVDGADTLSEWELTVLDDGIRATDAEGIQQYVGTDSDVVEFDVVEAGDGEELQVKKSSDNPEADTLKVEDDKKSDMHSVLAFEIESEESDFEFDSVDVVVESDEAVADVISDLVLEIDGEEFDDWSFVTGAAASTTRTVRFDIDGDYTLDADSEVTAVLKVEFKAANGSNYASGATFEARIADEAIDAEGAEDLLSDGTATGEEFVLATEGIVVPASSVETTTRTQGDNDTTGIFTIEFDVTAFEQDFYIEASNFAYSVQGASTSTDSDAVLSSTADEDTTDVFTVAEGETETFTLTVTVSDVATSGLYRVILDSINYSAEDDGVTNDETKTLDATDFRTDYENINDTI